MIRFIKLTECNGNKILLNCAHIEHMCVGAQGKDTYVKMVYINGRIKESYFFVKETIEDIWNMVTTDNPKAQIVMNAVDTYLLDLKGDSINEK